MAITFLFQVEKAALPLGESTLALDEEILKVLDADNLAKPAVHDTYQTALKRNAQEQPESSSSALGSLRSVGPFAHNKSNSCMVLSSPTNKGQPSIQAKEGNPNNDFKRPGWTTDCKDLAQKLLFGEDSEELENARKDSGRRPSTSAPTCNNEMPCPEIKSHQQTGRSTK